MINKGIKSVVSVMALVGIAYAALGQEYAAHSVLSSGEWYKVGVEEEGVYRIGADQLPALTGKSLSGIALYGLGGGMMGETNAATDRNDLRACRIWVNDANGNGTFDNGDYLYFYGEGASRWYYSDGADRFRYQRHAYAKENYYYLTTTATQATRIDTLATVDLGLPRISDYTSVAVHDDDLVNAHGTGRIYVGEKFTSAVASRTISITMPAASDQQVSARYAFMTDDAPRSTLTIALGSSRQTHVMNAESYYYLFENDFATQGTSTLSFTLSFSTSGNQAAGYLDFIELNAKTTMVFSGGQQVFRMKPTADEVLYSMTNRREGVRLWDVSDACDVHELRYESKGESLLFQPRGEGSHAIVAFDGSQLLTPKSVVPLANQDLHSLRDIEYVVVTHRAYTEQAERLAMLHRVEDMMTAAVVSDEQVYNEFSSGKQDPMAIRSLMRMLWQRAGADPTIRKPRYLLLFGKGSYDNRNIEGLGQTTVVSYETENSVHETDSYCSDDMLCFLDNGESGTRYDQMDISVGRLPARSSDEADHMVDKITRYVYRDDYNYDGIRGDWRTYVALLADDADPSSPGDSLFAHSAEDLANHIKTTYPIFNIDRIYADAYVQQSGAIGSFYPDVNNALKKRMDYGCLLLNYIGHGSMQYIGTERYISFSDISGYGNHHQPAFLVTSTCTYGKYDVPGGTCGSEYMLLAEGGAVGCISASRPIHHIEQFNTDVCMRLLDRGTRVGDALRMAKGSARVSPSISLLGDPAMQLSQPMDNVVVTAVNQHDVSDGLSDTASALAEVTIAGTIVDDSGAIINDFDGKIFATVFDRETHSTTLANDNEGTEVGFMQQKNILYKGVGDVSGGRFEYTFVVPRDINFSYAPGKLSHYARSDRSDAAGSYGGLVFGGFDTTATFSVCRPQIRLFLNDTNFRDGGSTDESPVLYAMLTDSVGINAVGSGLGHDITAVLDGRGNSVAVLNDFYEPDMADSRGGTVRYELSNLAEGRHTLTLKAWNIYNYSGEAILTFYVHRKSSPVVTLFQSYPNPASDRTRLRIEHNMRGQIAKAEIFIFDHRGQQVRYLQPAISDNSYVVGPIEWDFTTATGARLSNGIYIARLQLTGADGEQYVEQTKIVKIQ
ncbi:MAG: type IX secretion system sortase PorU [Bacteroidales bacterium]|nr:type IX secretion system sortase PorU [Bacteroidales bacterium]